MVKGRHSGLLRLLPSLKRDGGGGACSVRGGAQAAGPDAYALAQLLGRGSGAAAAAGGAPSAATMGETEKLYYVYSCDLDINVQLKM